MARPKLKLEDNFDNVDNKLGKVENADAAHSQTKEDTLKAQWSVRKLLKESGPYVDKSTQERFLQKLDGARRPEETAQIMREIASLQWKNRLKGKEFLFAKDSSKGSTFAQEFAEFQKLPMGKIDEQTNLKTQIGVLRQLDKLISERQSQFDTLYAEFGNQRNVPHEFMDEFLANGRRGRIGLLDKLNTSKGRFESLQKTDGWRKLSSKEQKLYERNFAMLGPHEREQLLTQLESSLNQVTQLDKDYATLKEIDEKHKLRLFDNNLNFATLPDHEKASALGLAKRKLIKHIKDKYKSVRKIMPPKDEESLDIWLEKTEIGDLGFWVSNAEKSIKKIKKVEKHKQSMIKEIAQENQLSDKESEAFFEEIAEHFDFDGKFAHQQLALFEDKTIDQYKNKIEAEKHKEEDEAYDKKLKELVKEGKYGLINERGAEEYRKWFRKQNLQKKKQINGREDFKAEEHDYLEQTLEKRRENNETFEGFNEAIQEEYHEKYKRAGFEERGAIITEIKVESANERAKYEAKMDDLIDKGLFAEKSKEPYFEEYFDLLSIKGMKLAQDNSDLDKDARQETLDTWQKIILPEIPEAEQEQAHKEFLSEDLDNRMKISQKYGEKYLDGGASGLKTSDLMKQIGIRGRTEQNLEDTIDHKASEAEQKADKAYKQEAKYDVALTYYEEALELTDETDPLNARKVKALKEQIAEMERLIAIKETGGVENPLDTEFNEAIDKATNSPKLKEKLALFTLFSILKRAADNANLQAGGGDMYTEDRLDKLYEEDEIQPEPVVIDHTHFLDPNDSRYNNNIHNTAFELDKEDPQKQSWGELQFTNEQGQEITTSQFADQVVNPMETDLHQEIAQIAAKELSSEIPDHPELQAVILENCLKRSEVRPSSALFVELEEKQSSQQELATAA